MIKLMTKEEIKIFCDAKLEELKPYFEQINAIALRFYTESDILSFPQYGAIENKLVGMYTFINAVYKEIDAMLDVYDAIKFNQLKVKSEIDTIKFVADVARHEAVEYTEELRVTAAILEGYTYNIEQLLATCRQHRFVDKKEHKYG